MIFCLDTKIWETLENRKYLWQIPHALRATMFALLEFNYLNYFFNYLGCGPGYYGYTDESGCRCVLCNKGTYNDKDHTHTCTLCPPESGTTLGRGSTSISDCQISRNFRYIDWWYFLQQIYLLHWPIVGNKRTNLLMHWLVKKQQCQTYLIVLFL